MHQKKARHRVLWESDRSTAQTSLEKKYSLKNLNLRKQDFVISCQSLGAQLLNACWLMPDACCLLHAWTLARPIHKRGGGRPPKDGSSRCSSIEQQAASKRQHQAASIMHQAASIKKLASKTLARTMTYDIRNKRNDCKPFRNHLKQLISRWENCQSQ